MDVTEECSMKGKYTTYTFIDINSIYKIKIKRKENYKFMQTTVTQLKAETEHQDHHAFSTQLFHEFLFFLNAKTYERTLGKVISFVFVLWVSTSVDAFCLRFKIRFSMCLIPIHEAIWKVLIKVSTGITISGIRSLEPSVPSTSVLPEIVFAKFVISGLVVELLVLSLQSLVGSLRHFLGLLLLLCRVDWCPLPAALVPSLILLIGRVPLIMMTHPTIIMLLIWQWSLVAGGL